MATEISTHNASKRKRQNLPILARRMVVLVLILTVISFYVGVYLYAYYYRKMEVQVLGPLGDALAPLTGFFSTIALLIAFASYSSQREELQLQRRELRLQRREFVRQREEMAANRAVQEKQEEAQAKQASLQEDANVQQKQANILTYIAMDAQILNLTVELQKLIVDSENEKHKINYDAAFRSNSTDVIAKALQTIRTSHQEIDQRLTALAVELQNLRSLHSRLSGFQQRLNELDV